MVNSVGALSVEMKPITTVEYIKCLFAHFSVNKLTLIRLINLTNYLVNKTDPQFLSENTQIS